MANKRIAIVGSRSIANLDVDMSKLPPEGAEWAVAERDWMFYHLDKLVGFDTVLDYSGRIAILSGGSVGVDRRAAEYAADNDVPFFLYKPYHLVDNKVEYRPRYFFTRNAQIVDNCDMLIAFWDGTSNGTRDTIKLAGKKGKDVVIIKPDRDAISSFLALGGRS